MPFTALRYEVADAVATITLDRPDALNALTVGLKADLLAAFGDVARDRAVRAVVRTGAGRAFCSGQDLKERLGPDAAPLAVELRERYNPIIRAMRTLDRPIVGAINGVAAGAGASLAFACDIRLAAEGATFVLAFGGGSGSCRTAAPRGCYRASSVPPRPPNWHCWATRCRLPTPSGSDWLPGSFPPRRLPTRRGRWRSDSPGWRHGRWR